MLDKWHVPFMIDNPVSSSEGGICHPIVSVAPQMSILSILQSFTAKNYLFSNLNANMYNFFLRM